MFKENNQHLQPYLISNINDLPEKQRRLLGNSWAGTFYQEVFCRIDEQLFSELYVDFPSRPNAPVNELVSLEILKAGQGWTDEEMWHHYLFDLQTRYALGLEQLGEAHFDLRTVYNFRERLSRTMQETGINLLDQVLRSTLRVPRSPISKLKLIRSKPDGNGWTAPKWLPISGKWAEFNCWSQSYSVSQGC
jgi:hypothetical protein